MFWAYVHNTKSYVIESGYVTESLPQKFSIDSSEIELFNCIFA